MLPVAGALQRQDPIEIATLAEQTLTPANGAPKRKHPIETPPSQQGRGR